MSGAVPDPWRRLGWVMWAPWMVFLVFPLIEAWQVTSMGSRLLALALTLAFATVYGVAVSRLGRPDCRRLLGLHEAHLSLLVILALAAATTPFIGLSALSFLPFVQALAVFGLPTPVNWYVVGSVLVLTVAGLALVGDFAEWGFFALILFAVTTATGAGRLMEEQGERYAAVRDSLAVSAERERVARDVHDVLGHSLTVVSVKADLAARLVEVDPSRARAELEDIQRLSRQALAEIRATVGGLRAARLGEELVAARTALLGAGIEPDLPADEQVVDPRYRAVVGWVLREAVTNVVRHSGARRCAVELAASAVVVTDDGHGLAGAAEGNGLRGLRERVESTGGRLDLVPGRGGAGTSLAVTW